MSTVASELANVPSVSMKRSHSGTVTEFTPRVNREAEAAARGLKPFKKENRE